MKRFKIYFGILTALLSIAGVTAARHYGGSVQWWYITAGGLYCAPYLSPCLVNSGFLTCVAAYTDGSIFHTFKTGTLYTRGSLFHGQPHFVAIDNCTHVLWYDGTL